MRITSATRTLLLTFVPLLGLTACVLPFSQRAHRTSMTDAPATSSSQFGSDVTFNSLAKHPLFQHPNLRMARQDCTFDYNATSGDAQNIEGYVAQEFGCMNRTWHAIFVSEGIKAASLAPDLKFVHKNPHKAECLQEQSTTPTSTCLHSLHFQSNNDKFRNTDGSMNVYSKYASLAIAYPWWVVDNIGMNDIEMDLEKSSEWEPLKKLISINVTF